MTPWFGRMPPVHTRWIELWCGGTLLAWALNLALMPAAFDNQFQWRPVARVFDNCTWAGLASAVGIGMALAAYYDWRWGRYAFASLAMLLFAALTDGLWLSQHPPAGWVLYASWACSMIPSVFRVLQLKRA